MKTAGTCVGLFANSDSAQLAEIAQAVRDLGGMPLTFDLRLGGEQAAGVNSGPVPYLTLESDGIYRWHEIDLSSLRALHLRGLVPRVPPALPPFLHQRSHAEYHLRALREQEFNAAIWAFFDAMSANGALVVNLPRAFVEHDTKGHFYASLADQGLPVPRTLQSTDAAVMRNFAAEVGRVVIKPAMGVGSTRMLYANDLDRLDDISLAPSLLQEFIEGDTLRVHVVGGEVVDSQRILSDGHVDSRTAPKGFVPHALTEQDAAQLATATTALGLHYAAWDVIAGNDGRLTYLDCNPGPYVMWLGKKTRRHVFLQLARYLLAYAREGSLEAARNAVRQQRSD